VSIWSFANKNNTKEVKKQVEHAPIVTAKNIGKTEKEKPETAQHSGLFAVNVAFVSLKRQFYQLIPTIVLGVK
jgi:hypothetical protein